MTASWHHLARYWSPTMNDDRSPFSGVTWGVGRVFISHKHLMLPQDDIDAYAYIWILHMYASKSYWGSINLDGRKLDRKGGAPSIAKIVVSRRKKGLKMFKRVFRMGHKVKLQRQANKGCWQGTSGPHHLWRDSFRVKISKRRCGFTHTKRI